MLHPATFPKSTMTGDVRDQQNDGSQLRYVTIRRALEAAIAEGRLAPGYVIPEGDLAELFGVSRNPVRKALQQLIDADILAPRTAEHGPVVRGEGMESLKHAPLTSDILGLPVAPTSYMQSSAQRVFADVDCMVSTGFLFGSYQILEQEAADYYGVSRMTIREVLGRLQDRGLVSKVPYGPWMVDALTADRIRQEYEIRELLEIRAAGGVAENGMPEIGAMLARVEHVLAAPETYLTEIEAIEADLHQTCLAAYSNPRLSGIVAANCTSQVIARVFFRVLPLAPDTAPVEEHFNILKAIRDRNAKSAQHFMHEHLQAACARNCRQLKTLSRMKVNDLPPYFVTPDSPVAIIERGSRKKVTALMRHRAGENI